MLARLLGLVVRLTPPGLAEVLRVLESVPFAEEGGGVDRSESTGVCGGPVEAEFEEPSEVEDEAGEGGDIVRAIGLSRTQSRRDFSAGRLESSRENFSSVLRTLLCTENACGGREEEPIRVARSEENEEGGKKGKITNIHQALSLWRGLGRDGEQGIFRTISP